MLWHVVPYAPLASIWHDHAQRAWEKEEANRAQVIVDIK